MEKDSKIFVAGHRGLVGSAILNNLRSKGYTNFLLRTHAAERPDYVFLSAAHVGGIMANSLYRADFIYNNLMIQNNVIHASWKNNVKKLLFLGSTCIYPREAPQPMPEDCLLTSPLEYSNEPYAIAKIAGIKMCESYNLQYGTNYIAVMPTNLYGPNDNFNLETSHVLPAMIRKIHLAKCLHTGDWEALRKDMDIRPVEGVSGKASEPEILSVLDKQGIRPGEVELWGTGKPLREFLWSEEMADASVYIMEHVDFEDVRQKEGEVRNTHINIGTGIELSIREVAELIRRKGYESAGFVGELTPNPQRHHIERVRCLREFLAGSGCTFDDARILNGCGNGVPEVPRVGRYSHADGQAGLRYLLDNKLLPRCIVCGNDDIATGLLKAARAQKLRIPEELAVIGFDDNENAEYLEPALTTIRQPLEEFGRLAVSHLLDKINDPARTIQMTIEPELIERSTT